MEAVKSFQAPNSHKERMNRLARKNHAFKWRTLHTLLEGTAVQSLTAGVVLSCFVAAVVNVDLGVR